MYTRDRGWLGNAQDYFDVLKQWEGVGRKGSNNNWWVEEHPACIWWTLWRERNAWCHERKASSVQMIKMKFEFTVFLVREVEKSVDFIGIVKYYLDFILMILLGGCKSHLISFIWWVFWCESNVICLKKKKKKICGLKLTMSNVVVIGKITKSRNRHSFWDKPKRKVRHLNRGKREYYFTYTFCYANNTFFAILSIKVPYMWGDKHIYEDTGIISAMGYRLMSMYMLAMFCHVSWLI